MFSWSRHEVSQAASRNTEIQPEKTEVEVQQELIDKQQQIIEALNKRIEIQQAHLDKMELLEKSQAALAAQLKERERERTEVWPTEEIRGPAPAPLTDTRTLKQAIAEEVARLTQRPQEPIRVAETVKFKLDMGAALKHVQIRRPDRLDPSMVLKLFGQVRQIETAASNAVSREPTSCEEWKLYFKFHLLHLEDSLQQILRELVRESNWTAENQFRVALYEELFPRGTVTVLFSKALAEYMPWTEPLGIAKWEQVTEGMIEFKVKQKGLEGQEFKLAVAMGKVEQLEIVLHECGDMQSREIRKIFRHREALLAIKREEEEPLTVLDYDKFYEAVMSYIRQELRVPYHSSHPYLVVFGHALQEHKTSNPPKQQQRPQAAHLSLPAAYGIQYDVPPPPPPPRARQVPPRAAPAPERQAPPALIAPSYALVTTEGGAGPSLNLRAAQTFRTEEETVFQTLDPVARTGIVRTWTWKQKTAPWDMTGRVPCNAKPPVDADPRCDYYGDYLDFMGVCSYCLRDRHLKAECRDYAYAQKKSEEIRASRQFQQSAPRSTLSLPPAEPSGPSTSFNEAEN